MPMIVEDCIPVLGYTVLVFNDDLPRFPWRYIVVDGIRYKPIPVMDAGENCIAVEGAYQLKGKEALFVT